MGRKDAILRNLSTESNADIKMMDNCNCDVSDIALNGLPSVIHLVVDGTILKMSFSLVVQM